MSNEYSHKRLFDKIRRENEEMFYNWLFLNRGRGAKI